MATRSTLALEPNEQIRLLKAQIKQLKLQLKDVEIKSITTESVKQHIFKLTSFEPEPPEWTYVAHRRNFHGCPGVPTLLISDLHWGERVDPAQIAHVNAYNLAIAHKRLRTLTEHTIDLLENHVTNPDFPGIVLAFAGDNFSGNIHDELSESNEKQIMDVFHDLFEQTLPMFTTFADRFGKVFVPCVTGNHGRSHKEVRHKDRAYSNYDWLLYRMLQTHFKHDPRFTFYIGDGPDVSYKIYNHRYLLTHTDQFRGGDGAVGAIGPIIRGDMKKRRRNNQIGQEYDTLIGGHWHQLILLRHLIINGSLKGMDEYAWSGNFPFEPPQQALWLTHPDYGITITMPVLVERPVKKKITEWVSLPSYREAA